MSRKFCAHLQSAAFLLFSSNAHECSEFFERKDQILGVRALAF